jgi:predicted Zn-ribbon and HTH transcriptional regulator
MTNFAVGILVLHSCAMTKSDLRERETTVRESIRQALLDTPLTARDLSKLIGISERDVADHLDHLARSLKHKGETLVIDSPSCLDCGFSFDRRQRYTRPSGCPRCRGRRIALPQFRIAR